MQFLSAPDGTPLWVSDVEPGSTPDITAARIHALPALYVLGPVASGVGDRAECGVTVHPGHVREDRAGEISSESGQRAVAGGANRDAVTARRAAGPEIFSPAAMRSRAFRNRPSPRTRRVSSAWPGSLHAQEWCWHPLAARCPSSASVSSACRNCSAICLSPGRHCPVRQPRRPPDLRIQARDGIVRTGTERDLAECARLPGRLRKHGPHRHSRQSTA
ncbi:hypothetical protein [Streptomyces sp. NBC_00576]|uniref:hypothetical protein n=1 Tax=Streptomyces sp. NBC_00576 TaxID=2903665 RepID=UPI003FCCCF03